MATWTAASRKAYYEKSPGNFASDGDSYPIKDGNDVKDAWDLAGHASDPNAVRSKIKSIAKRLGLTDSLPDTAKDDTEERSMGANNILTRAIPANHDPMTGSHAHSHPAHDSQGDDATHEHEHTHADDASHDHAHSEDRAAMPTSALLYAPIVRIDKEKREVEGVATSESVDSFGTIFSYEASKKAFQSWMEKTPNVREMHERKAAGKGIQLRFDDAARQIHVRTFVSRGAQDTWLKVEDGVLNGYSVGAVNPVWDTVTRDGKKYPYLVSYDLAELSLVDNASNPDAQGLAIARADGLTDVVDITEENPSLSAPTALPVGSSSLGSGPVLRAGARVSADTRASLHEARNHSLQSAKKMMDTCGCGDCVAASNALDPDQDGDIDWMCMDDPDGDGAAMQQPPDDSERALIALIERILPVAIERAMGGVYQRQQQFLARMAQVPERPEIILPPLDTTALEERITAAIERVAASSSQSEVRASLTTQMEALEAVKETVERIAAQPMPGGPMLNGARPADKHLVNDFRAGEQGVTPEMRVAFYDELQRKGLLNTPELQMEAAQAAIVRMPGRMG